MIKTSVQEAPSLATREERALELFRTRGREIERIEPDVYLVPSCTGETTYRVDLGDETCDCPDHRYRAANCLHILAACVKRAKRRGTTARRLAVLEDRLSHELLDAEERCELASEVARLRSR